MEEIPGSEKFFPAQLVFLALGFLGPESDVIKSLAVNQDARSNIQTPHKVITFISVLGSDKVSNLVLAIHNERRGCLRCW